MRVYLDNAATTGLDPKVLEKMNQYFLKDFGNPSSWHSFGRDALKGVDRARDKIADILGAKNTEIYFTSCGTESDNWALRGAIKASRNLKKHIVTTEIEHPAILDTCRDLEKDGIEVTYVGVNSDGQVSVDDIKNAINKDTVIVSVMTANNEIGSIQPISEIGEFCRDEGIYFHTDAVQAAESEDLNVDKLNVDLLSLSAHKFHGPKGIGILYIRSGVKLAKLMTGGHQERGQRAGTTNTPLIVGMAEALDITVNNRDRYVKQVSELRDYLIERALKEIQFVHLNGGRTKRLPNNVNLSFDFIEGESLLMMLDLSGVAVSSGSACSSGSLEPSHVILALGVKPEVAHGSVRFSLGRDTKKEEIDFALDSLKKSVTRLREISPLFNVQNGEGYYV
ncbi:MAG: cysteine desulfurase NifS [Christensenellaceae bacterium]|jgi:cysteine desulfurase|nr:cysteine desulfurase NifS [Christensenellaceae bacterium]